MKRITILWTIIILILIIGLTVLGLFIKNNNIDNILETTFETQVKSYLGEFPGLYPTTGNTAVVYSQELIDAGYDTGLDKDCKGYMIITSENITYKYDTFISCPNYTTEGYRAED